MALAVTAVAALVALAALAAADLMLLEQEDPQAHLLPVRGSLAVLVIHLVGPIMDQAAAVALAVLVAQDQAQQLGRVELA